MSGSGTSLRDVALGRSESESFGTRTIVGARGFEPPASCFQIDGGSIPGVRNLSHDRESLESGSGGSSDGQKYSPQLKRVWSGANLVVSGFWSGNANAAAARQRAELHIVARLLMAGVNLERHAGVV